MSGKVKGLGWESRKDEGVSVLALTPWTCRCGRGLG